MRQAESLMLARARAHFYFAVRLDAIESGSIRVGKQLAPAVVDVDHQLGDQLVERVAARPRNDVDAAGLAVRTLRIPVDIEVVIDACDIRLATLISKPLGELPPDLQFGSPRCAG